jgi:hypothetical protein
MVNPISNRRFPPPWTIERLPGGFKVVDAHGQSLAYFYARDNDNDAGTGGVLTMDEARRFARRRYDKLGRERVDNPVAAASPIQWGCYFALRTNTLQ